RSLMEAFAAGERSNFGSCRVAFMCRLRLRMFFRRSANHAVNGLPQRLQNLAPGSFDAAPQEEHDCPILRLAPQEEQKSEPATFAAPHVPHRPGRGGT